VSLIRDAPFSLVPKFSSTASERVCCSGQQSGLRHSAKYSFAVYTRVDQSVTECYDLVVGRVRPFPPLQGSPAFFLPLFTDLPRRGILRTSGAGSCIDRPPRGVRMASKTLHASWRRSTSCGVGWICSQTKDPAIAITFAAVLLHRSPTPAQRFTQVEGRRGVREDGDPAIRGLYRLVSELPSPLCAQFHWPFRRRNIFLAFLIRGFRPSMSVSRARILRCSSVDL
jgi:hypothetical protein